MSALYVRIYSTPICPHSIAAKNYFIEHHIYFEEIDASREEKIAEEILRKCGRLCVPVIEINGNILVGFQKEIVDAIINNLDSDLE